MTGRVDGREARIKVQVRGPTGRRATIQAIVDTGSTGWLTLPPDLISLLELPRLSSIRALLADGSETVLDVYEAVVIWNRRHLGIRVDAAEFVPLVGMSLLSNCELRIEVRPGGKVSIKPLARR